MCYQPYLLRQDLAKNLLNNTWAYINLSEWKGVAHSVGGYFMNQKYPVKKKKENKQADPQTTIHKSTKINGIFQLFFRIPLLVFYDKKAAESKKNTTDFDFDSKRIPKKTNPSTPKRGKPGHRPCGNSLFRTKTSWSGKASQAMKP